MRFVRIVMLLVACLSFGLSLSTAQDYASPKLMVLQEGIIYTFDPLSRTTETLVTGADGSVQYASSSPDGRYLAYMDETGTLRWSDRQTGTTTVFPPRPTPTFGWPEGEPYTSYVRPDVWSGGGRLVVLQGLWEGLRPGWSSVDDPVWHEFPPRPELPEDLDAFTDDLHYYGAGDFAWSPDGLRLIFASGGPGTSDYFISGLTLINLRSYFAQRIVAQEINYPPESTTIIAGAHHPSWSPDGTWIAFRMGLDVIQNEDGIYFPEALYVVRPDGSDLTLVKMGDKPTIGGCHIWTPSGQLLYVEQEYRTDVQYLGAEPGQLYRYDPQAGTHTLILPDISCPISLSPDDRFISHFGSSATTLYAGHLEIISLDTQERISVSSDELSFDSVLGWTID